MKRSHEGNDDEQQLNGHRDRRRKCPYLDTIQRHMLDFDLEKICSVSLSNQNIYMCLVCGKLYQGRGKMTHAYTHSVDAGHHVFINLHNGKIYCLPDLYEVIDSSLDDIRMALRPEFKDAEIAKLEQNKNLAHDIFGVAYLPGFVGLNNLKNTDFINVAIQALAHVEPLRNFFLDPANYEDDCKNPVVIKFGELIRKLWSSGNFKSTVSPHELVEEITVSSKRRFVIGEQNEVVTLMSWLLNELHAGLTAGSKKKSSIIYQTFQGQVDVLTEKEEDAIDGKSMQISKWSARSTPFLYLSLDLPATPLFKDSQGGNIIPQIPLFTVLQKYDGSHITDELRSGVRQRKKYILKQMPPYLVFHLKRFNKNNFFTEKNPTIVNFPVKNLELKEYVSRIMDEDILPADKLEILTVKELQTLLKRHSVKYDTCVEKSDLVQKILTEVYDKLMEKFSTKYDLIANICHDSPSAVGGEKNQDPLSAGHYRVHVVNKATNQWYEIQDLHVQETLPQLIALSESYLMIYERKRQ